MRTEDAGRVVTPTVSVIITTYNYAAFISEAIDSVLNQTVSADEIIVVDDGSTDDTFDVLARYRQRGQITYVRQPNQGPSAARNRGIQESSGNLVAFLDADDTWLSEKLELQLAWLEDHLDASMVSGQMIWWHVEGGSRRVVRFEPLSPTRLRRELVIRNVAGNPSMALIRRNAIDKVGIFDTALRWGEDWEFFFRLSRVGELGFVTEPVIVYRWHRQNLSHERRLDQLAMNHVVGRRNVAVFEPAWQRPILRARVWSAIEYDRARIITKLNVSRLKLVRHAALALISWPFENTLSKIVLLARVTVGEARYQRLAAGVRGRMRRTRSAV